MIEFASLTAMVILGLMSTFAMSILDRSWYKAYNQLVKAHSDERREWYEERKGLLERINNGQ